MSNQDKFNASPVCSYCHQSHHIAAPCIVKQMLVKDKRIVQLEEECKRLWGLLDNISTAGDAYKPDHTPYFKYVNGECEKRDGLFYSDGYNILETKHPAPSGIEEGE